MSRLTIDNKEIINFDKKVLPSERYFKHLRKIGVALDNEIIVTVEKNEIVINASDNALDRIRLDHGDKTDSLSLRQYIIILSMNNLFGSSNRHYEIVPILFGYDFNTINGITACISDEVREALIRGYGKREASKMMTNLMGLRIGNCIVRENEKPIVIDGYGVIIDTYELYFSGDISEFKKLNNKKIMNILNNWKNNFKIVQIIIQRNRARNYDKNNI